MLLFTNDKIAPMSRIARRTTEHFLPGELYIMRFMRTPTVVTVLARTNDEVVTWTGRHTVEAFNQRVLMRLGRRRRFLGIWLPWITLDPSRVIAYGLADSLGTDQDFWRNEPSL